MSKILTAICFFLFVQTINAQDDIPGAVWIKEKVVIDGMATEWKKPLRFYDANTKLFYAFENDDKNFYLCFQTNDEINQQKILRGGVKVSLQAKTGDKRNVSIRFPLASREPQGKQHYGQDSTENKLRRENRKLDFLAQNTMMETKGFAERNGVIPINDTSGINAAINWDEAGDMIYEIAIPLKEVYGNGYTAADLSKYVLMEVEVNGVKRGEHAEGGGGAGFGGRGRGGHMGGGGGRYRGTGTHEESNNGEGSFGNRMAMFEKTTLKQKFVPAMNGN